MPSILILVSRERRVATGLVLRARITPHPWHFRPHLISLGAGQKTLPESHRYCHWLVATHMSGLNHPLKKERAYCRSMYKYIKKSVKVFFSVFLFHWSSVRSWLLTRVLRSLQRYAPDSLPPSKHIPAGKEVHRCLPSSWNLKLHISFPSQ